MLYEDVLAQGRPPQDETKQPNSLPEADSYPGSRGKEVVLYPFASLVGEV